jgi:hypothetical protein
MEKHAIQGMITYLNLWDDSQGLLSLLGFVHLGLGFRDHKIFSSIIIWIEFSFKMGWMNFLQPIL